MKLTLTGNSERTDRNSKLPNENLLITENVLCGSVRKTDLLIFTKDRKLWRVVIAFVLNKHAMKKN